MLSTCEIEPRTVQQKLIQLFSQAMAHYQLSEIEELLDDGNYCYFCNEGERVETNREGFLEYLQTVFLNRIQLAMEPAKIEMNQCVACLLGNPALLFDDGTFPHHSNRDWPTKVGLMLEIEDGRIKAIRPCTAFENTANNPERQRQLEYMRNNPLTREDFESDAFDDLVDENEDEG